MFRKKQKQFKSMFGYTAHGCVPAREFNIIKTEDGLELVNNVDDSKFKFECIHEFVQFCSMLDDVAQKIDELEMEDGDELESDDENGFSEKDIVDKLFAEKIKPNLTGNIFKDLELVLSSARELLPEDVKDSIQEIKLGFGDRESMESFKKELAEKSKNMKSARDHLKLIVDLAKKYSAEKAD